MRGLSRFLAATALVGCTPHVVETGTRGVKVTLGKVDKEPMTEGLHWVNPFLSRVETLGVQEQKLEDKTECFTRDTQKVDVSFVLSFYASPDKVVELYSQFGPAWVNKIVPQVALSSLKDTTGRYVADDLVGKREEARAAAFEEIKNSLATRFVVATRLDLTNLDFDDAYEKAVESKVVATQKAAEAKNKTVEVEEQAKQMLISAEAEAKSMRIRAQELSGKSGLLEWQWINKWDGKLPTHSFGANAPMPVLDLRN